MSVSKGLSHCGVLSRSKVASPGFRFERCLDTPLTVILMSIQQRVLVLEDNFVKTDWK